jgi:hypothetical protein
VRGGCEGVSQLNNFHPTYAAGQMYKYQERPLRQAIVTRKSRDFRCSDMSVCSPDELVKTLRATRGNK